jgi:hypothetical protein
LTKKECFSTIETILYEPIFEIDHDFWNLINDPFQKEMDLVV